MPNVIAIMPGEKHELGGCEIYRISMPFHYLQKKSPEWQMQWVFYNDLARLSAQDSNFFKRLAYETDLFVFPRMYFKNDQAFNVFKDLLTSLHILGKKVIYEVDDDMSNTDREVVDGDAMACMALCDAVTVTTKYLKEAMRKYTSKPIYILPNMIAPETWCEPATGTFLIKDKLFLGLSGSTTHIRDWEVLKDVLPKIMQDDNLHLLMTGFHPDYLKDLPNTTYLPAYSYTQYAQIIQHCGIILCSVNNEPFNLGKSPIKAIEGMAARRFLNGQPAGAAVITSNHPIYQLAVQHNKTGLLVDHTPQGWLQGLDQLIYDEKLRHRLQVDGHSWVLKHHDISKTSSLWANAYQAVLRSPILA